MAPIQERILARVTYDQVRVSLILFLASSPDRWFPAAALARSCADLALPCVAALLEDLADDGFVDRKRDEEATLYALTRHPEVRKAALWLASQQPHSE